jgi:hypothetical protein
LEGDIIKVCHPLQCSFPQDYIPVQVCDLHLKWDMRKSLRVFLVRFTQSSTRICYTGVRSLRSTQIPLLLFGSPQIICSTSGTTHFSPSHLKAEYLGMTWSERVENRHCCFHGSLGWDDGSVCAQKLSSHRCVQPMSFSTLFSKFVSSRCWMLCEIVQRSRRDRSQWSYFYDPRSGDH